MSDLLSFKRNTKQKIRELLKSFVWIFYYIILTYTCKRFLAAQCKGLVVSVRDTMRVKIIKSNCRESLTWNLRYLCNFDLYFILIRIRIEGLKRIFYLFCYIHTKNKEFLCIRIADVGLWWAFLHFSLIDFFEPHYIYLFKFINQIQKVVCTDVADDIFK